LFRPDRELATNQPNFGYDFIRRRLFNREPAMPTKKPLKPEDFPVRPKETKIITDSGESVAEARDKETAKDVADRLNSDNAREEEDRWA
jgi:hypothetical protein